MMSRTPQNPVHHRTNTRLQPLSARPHEIQRPSSSAPRAPPPLTGGVHTRFSRVPPKEIIEDAPVATTLTKRTPEPLRMSGLAFRAGDARHFDANESDSRLRWVAAGPMLKVEDLVVRFGAVTAVDGVSFDVRRGEVLCLLGPSGSGKSTLLRVIAGVERSTSGRVVLDGV